MNRVIRAEDWIVDPDDRTTFYGATDAAGILGLNSYHRPIDIYLEKREKIIKGGSPRARWGQLLEQAVCDGYSESTGWRVYRVHQVRHPTIAYIIGHPDRRVVGQRGILDAKTTERRDEYGEPGTDEVPARVRVQMVVYTGLMAYDWADVALLAGTTRGLDTYRVKAQPELYQAAVDAVVEFHETFVLPGVPPEPDGSAAWSDFIARRYSKDDGSEMAPATPEQMLWLEDLRAAVLVVGEAEGRRDRAIQLIQRSMRDHTVLPSIYGRISWKRQGPSVRWGSVANAVARDLATELEADPTKLLSDYAAADKAERAGPRVFRHPFRAPGREEEEHTES